MNLKKLPKKVVGALGIQSKKPGSIPLIEIMSAISKPLVLDDIFELSQAMDKPGAPNKHILKIQLDQLVASGIISEEGGKYKLL